MSLPALESSGWRASPLSSQWRPNAAPVAGQTDSSVATVTNPVTPSEAGSEPAASRPSPLASKPTGMLSSVMNSAVNAGNVVSGKPAAGSDVSVMAPTEGQTSPLVQKPATDQGVKAPVAETKPYKSPSIPWTKDAPAPKTADGREFMVWGGDKNINGQKFYVDPDAYASVRGQLDTQRKAMMDHPEYGKFWRATDKGEKTPDWVLDDMAKNLVASGVTDIRQIGKGQVLDKGMLGSQQVFKKEDGTFVRKERQGASFDDEGVEVEVPVKPEDAAKIVSDEDGKFYIPKYKDAIINKETGQPIISQYGGRTDASKGIWGGTYKGSGNTGYGVTFDKDGLPVFYTAGASSKDGIFRELAKAGPLLSLASFIPGLQWLRPIGSIASGTAAASNGNVLGAVAGFAGAAPGIADMAGFSGSMGALDIGGVAVGDIAKGAGLINSVKNKDPLSALVTGGDLMGLSDIGGVKLTDIRDANNLRKAVKGKNPLAIANAGWRLVD